MRKKAVIKEKQTVITSNPYSINPGIQVTLTAEKAGKCSILGLGTLKVHLSSFDSNTWKAI